MIKKERKRNQENKKQIKTNKQKNLSIEVFIALSSYLI